MAGPTLVAAFANSPAPGWKSARMGWWMAMDPQYTVSPADWATQVLDAPVMLIRVADDDFRAMPATRSFRQWITDGHPLGFPTEDDLAYHVTTLFPPVRCRGWLELRMLDALPSPWWEVATAVTVAILAGPRRRRATAARAPRSCGRRRPASGSPTRSSPGPRAAASPPPSRPSTATWRRQYGSTPTASCRVGAARPTICGAPSWA